MVSERNSRKSDNKFYSEKELDRNLNDFSSKLSLQVPKNKVFEKREVFSQEFFNFEPVHSLNNLGCT